MLPDVNISKASGLNQPAPNTDSFSALCFAGYSIAPSTGITGLVVGQIVQLRSTADANALGLNDAYDTAHLILVYHHIKRHFLRCPTSVLSIMLVPIGTTMVQMVTKTNLFGAKMLQLGAGSIKQIGFVLNPVGYGPVAIAETRATQTFHVAAGSTAIPETIATITNTVTAVGGTGDSVTIEINQGAGWLLLATATLPGSGTPTNNATAIRNAINGAGTNVAATGNGTPNVITSAGAGTGAGANGWMIRFTDTAVSNTFSITNNVANFSGGVTAVSPTVTVSVGATTLFTATLGTLSATATAASIGGHASSNGYDFSSSTDNFIITCPIGSGAGANATTATIVTTGTITINAPTNATFTGGVTAITLEPAASGMNDDILAAIPVAQALADSEYAAFRPIDIILEGRCFNGSASAFADKRTLASGQVGLVLGADNDVSAMQVSGATPYLHYAAVGDVLGTIAQAKVNQSIGWAKLFNLSVTGAVPPVFINPGLSSGLPLVTTSTINYSALDLGTLYDKGCIVPRFITNKPGVFWAGYPTCQLVTADDSFGEYSRTLNKGSRLLRTSFLDSINGEVTLNADGTIIATQVADMEKTAEIALDVMLTNGEVSGPSVVKIIQTDQDGNPVNFVTNGSKLKYAGKILIKGVMRSIDGTVSLSDGSSS